eukprot:PITA_07587
MVFAELISELPCGEDTVYEEIFPDEHLFFISSLDPWYGDIIVYLQTSKFTSTFSKDERRKLRHLTKNYVNICDTLYCPEVDSILRRCLTLEEAESMLNDCHSGACGGHLSGLATTQRILCVGYFWPSLFKDCVEVVKCCHPCQVYTQKMHAHPAPLFPVVTVGPFTKWGIDFTTCNLPLALNHKYIIVAVDYFTKWDEAMPTYKNDSETATLFLFNQIISRTSVKTATGFTPFQLVYGLESIFPVKCEITSLKLDIELLPETSSLKERLVHLEHLDAQRRDAATVNEAHKKRVKTQYDKAV